MNRPLRLVLPFLPALLAACASERAAPAPKVATLATPEASATAPKDDSVRSTPAAIAAPVEVAVAGAATIGDSLIPGDGNGGYDVQKYALELDVEAPAGPLVGKCTIDARATQALSSFNLDFHGLDVVRILVDGAVADFERADDELTVKLPQPLAKDKDFRCVVEYFGSPEGVKDPSMPGFSMGWIERDGEAYVFSQPGGAKTFFPCNDHPLDKALFSFRLRVPKPLQAVANGKLLELLEEDSARTYVWSARDPMATYLVTIAIAEFESETYTSASGLEITNWFTKKSRESSRKAFQKTDEILEFFSASFGPYPFEIAGNILTSARVPGALETQTKPVYGAGTGTEDVIAHELAHQWFGDAVCVEDWNDIWINEGVAEYAAWMYVESQEGAEGFAKKLKESYAMARAMKATPPGHITVRQMFGAAVYLRGPFALHFLRRQMGDERFLALMKRWMSDHLHGNASLEDFLALVDELGGKDARAAIDPWLFDDSMPAVAEWDAYVAERKKEQEARRAQREAERAERDAKRKAQQAEEDTKKNAPKPEEPAKDGASGESKPEKPSDGR
ncbi:MAG: M1 family aminopeptidase [Planctomycetota bacterium]|nr:M1 family aminopeptidase [Planctomycetota bacterium]